MSSPPPRPAGLTAVCIFAILLGSLGTCGSFGQLASSAAQAPMREFNHRLARMQNQPVRMRRAQERMQDRVDELTAAWLPMTATHSVLNLIACLALLIGGVMGLSYKPLGRELMIASTLANAAADVMGVIVSGFMQRDLMPVMSRYMREVSETLPGRGADEVGKMMEGMVGVSLIGGIALALVMMAVKLAFYVAAAVYLRKPDVARLFR